MRRDKAIENLMDQYGTKVLHLAYSYVRNKQTAEDLAQEIFLKCFQKYETFQGEAQVQTWLFSVASNHCKDYLKSWHHRKIFVSSYISSRISGQQAGPEKQLIQNAENKELADAMFELPVKYREIIFLFYFQECSLKEIAAICDLNINTVKSRLTRAKELLKGILQERGVEYGGTAEETEIRNAEG